MSEDIAIRRQDNESGGAYLATLADSAAAGELSYTRRAPGVIVANHTGVPPQMQGRGIAQKLVERLVADARAEGFRIVPVCSYVAAWRKRHPEAEDVFIVG